MDRLRFSKESGLKAIRQNPDKLEIYFSERGLNKLLFLFFYSIVFLSILFFIYFLLKPHVPPRFLSGGMIGLLVFLTAKITSRII
jgi:hypothetical protein